MISSKCESKVWDSQKNLMSWAEAPKNGVGVQKVSDIRSQTMKVFTDKYKSILNLTTKQWREAEIGVIWSCFLGACEEPYGSIMNKLKTA